MPRRNRIQVEVEGKDNASKVLNKVGDALARFATLGFVKELAEGAVELGKLGLQANAARARLDAFAGGADKAEAILSAIRETTGGTISELDAMAASTRFLSMGLASTADESAALIKMATRLGDQTQDAGDRIENFSLLLANQSIPRLDSFGISAGAVRKRINELTAANEGMSRETAFMTAVMEEGGKSLDTLGDAGLDATKSGDRLKAAVSDLSVAVGQEFAPAVAEGTSRLADFVRGLADAQTRMNEVRGEFDAATVSQAVFNERFGLSGVTLDDLERKMNAVTVGMGDLQKAQEGAHTATTLVIPAVENETNAMAVQAEIAADAAAQTDLFAAAQQRAADNAAMSAVAFRDSAAALGEMGEAQFAQAQIAALQESMEAGNISRAQFSEAQGAILEQFGLLTESEKQAQERLSELIAEFEAGVVPADMLAISMEAVKFQLDNAEGPSRLVATNLADLTGSAEDAAIAFPQLGDSVAETEPKFDSAAEKAAFFRDVLGEIPRKITVDIEVNAPTSLPEIGDAVSVPGLQHGFTGVADKPMLFAAGEGGPEFVNVVPLGGGTTNNNFNMTVNTAATAPTVQQDFQTMAALSGAAI